MTMAFSLAVNLDHVGWWVDDLEAVSRQFDQLGFSVTRPASLLTGTSEGDPRDEGQRSSHVMFRDTYLELTTVIGSEIPGHLSAYQGGSGLKIVALGCADADARHDDLENVERWDLVATSRSQRELSYASQPNEPVRFKWFMATPTQFPEVLVCLVEHLDRQRLFDPSVTRQPNGVTELTEVLMLSDDPEGSFTRYRPLEASAGDTTGWLTFITRDQARLAYPGAALPSLGAGGCVPLGVVLEASGLDFFATQQAPHAEGQFWFAAPGNTLVVIRSSRYLKDL